MLPTKTVFKKSVPITVVVMILAFASACATRYNPLDDYQELEPATILEAPQPDAERAVSYDPLQVSKGKYLVELLGCGSCHTDGALVGKPNFSKSLAGSRVGIAYTNPLQQKHPGVVYPANLTSDVDTGLGSWSDKDIVRAIQYGVDKHGRQQLPVMPWLAYTKVRDKDAYAIVAYLRSLPPIEHRVPRHVLPGQKTRQAYIHFGVYQSRKP